MIEITAEIILTAPRAAALFWDNMNEYERETAAALVAFADSTEAPRNPELPASNWKSK